MLPFRKRIKLSRLLLTALFIFGLSTSPVWASEPITVALILAETGTITFDQNGDPMNKEASIIKFSGGFANFVKSVKP